MRLRFAVGCVWLGVRDLSIDQSAQLILSIFGVKLGWVFSHVLDLQVPCFLEGLRTSIAQPPQHLHIFPLLRWPYLTGIPGGQKNGWGVKNTSLVALK